MRRLLFLLGVVTVSLGVSTSTAFGRVHVFHLGHHRDGGYAAPIYNNNRSDEDHSGGGGVQGGSERGDHGDRHTFVCNGTYTQMSVRNLVVPQSGVCLITNSTISGRVDVPNGGDFEAGTTSIRGDVKAYGAQTVYIYAGSTVGGDIKTNATAQTQIFNSTVNGEIRVRRGTDQVYLCNNTVDQGISVRRSGPDILVGDHLDPNCPGNVVNQGNISVTDNATYVELVVGDNSVPSGNIFVRNNGGTPSGISGESVQGNQGGNALICTGNASPFVGSPNPGWSRYVGQCSA